MMRYIHQAIRSLLTATLALAGVAVMSTFLTLSASTVVVSNLETTGGSNASRLLDAVGRPLAAGSWVRLGNFNALSDVEIIALARTGSAELLARFVPYGASSTVGTGVGGTAGEIEFASDAPLSAPLSRLHAVIFNAPSPAQASEVMVLSLPGNVPGDDPSGLVGYLAVSLEDTGLVVGSASTSGISSVPFLSKYEAWLEAQMSGSLAETLLPGEDADGDGLANLVEYALGSAAGDAGSRSEAKIARESNILRVRFIRRQDDPSLIFTVQKSRSLAAGDWETVVGSPVEMASPPSPAPVGCVWVEQDIPSVEEILFVRIRVSAQN